MFERASRARSRPASERPLDLVDALPRPSSDRPPDRVEALPMPRSTPTPDGGPPPLPRPPPTPPPRPRPCAKALVASVKTSIVKTTNLLIIRPPREENLDRIYEMHLAHLANPVNPVQTNLLLLRGLGVSRS